MADKQKQTVIHYDPRLPTYELKNCIYGFKESDDCVSEEGKSLMEQVIGELMFHLRIMRFTMFILTGLVVTNAVWGAHFLGWL